MKCLAINPQWYDDLFLSFPLGLSTIVSIVMKEGHQVSVVDFDANRIEDNDKEKFLKELKIKPDIVLLTGMITNYSRIQFLGNAVKKIWPDSRIILGGSLASTAPDQILLNIKADIFVVGEGDETIKEILKVIESKSLSLNSIPGIKFRVEDRIYKTSERLSPDITKTPRPAYEEFPMDTYTEFLKRSGRCFEIYSSKGCPSKCYFCYKVSGSKVRHRLVHDVVNEIRFVKSRYGIQRFSFEDDSFGLDRRWVEDFCTMIKDDGIKFRFQANVMTLREELLDKLKEAGLDGVSLGIESGSQKIIQEIGKRIDLIIAEKLIAVFKSKKIKFNATFIIGSPGEDQKSIDATKDFLIRNGFDSNFQIFFLNPYPGTVFYDEAINKGLIKDEVQYIQNLKLQDTLTLNMTEYSNEQLILWRDYIIESTMGKDKPKIVSGVTWKKEAI